MDGSNGPDASTEADASTEVQTAKEVDASTEADASNGTDAADSGPRDPCTGPFEYYSRFCPATFDGTAAGFPSCASRGDVSTRRCFGKIELLTVESGPMYVTACYYDPGTHALVGVWFKIGDSASCGTRAGDAPTNCRTPATATRDCSSDAGAGN